MPKTLINGAFKAADGTPVSSGTLVLTLSMDAQVIAGGNIEARDVNVIQLDVTGNVTGAASVYGQDELSPGNTYYSAEVLNIGGSTVWGPTKWVFSGASPIDLNLMVPTLINPDPAYSEPVLKNPITDQVIRVGSLNPATGNTTQSLGSTSAPWDAVLDEVTIQDSITYGTGTNISTVVLGGAADPYQGLIQNASNALGSSGGVIDARAVGVSAVSQGAFDPGTKAVTVLLGPYTYLFSQISVRNSFRMIGVGSGGLTQQTVVQSSASTTDLFVIGGSSPVAGIEIAYLRIYGQGGSSGATQQSALSFIAQINGGGVWYSSFHDLVILGFAGLSGTHGIIRLDGSAGGSPPAINQFDTFRNVYAYRPSGGGPVVEILGFTGQIHFIDCQLDSNSGVSTGTNITISATSSSLFPFNILFDNVTTQGGAVAVNMAGCNAITFNQMHHEVSAGAYLISSSAAAGNTGIQIINSQFNSNVGTGGSGYLVNFVPAATSGSVLFTGNNFGSPDAIVTGNVAAVTQYSNTGGGTTVGGTEWNTANGFPYLTVNTGIVNNGSGLKHKRVTTGSVGGGTRVSVTVTWTTNFLDTNYTVTAAVLDATTGGTAQGLVLERLNSILVGSIQATVFNPTGGALTGTLSVIAVHD